MQPDYKRALYSEGRLHKASRLAVFSFDDSAIDFTVGSATVIETKAGRELSTQ